MFLRRVLPGGITRRREILSRFIFPPPRIRAAHGMKTSSGPQPEVAATSQIKLQHCSKEHVFDSPKRPCH